MTAEGRILLRSPTRSCSTSWPSPSKRLRAFLAQQRGFRLEEIIEKDGFERNAAIAAAKEVVNENDETRKRFEIMARTVFRQFRACLTVKEVHVHRSAYDAINIVYKSLQEDRDNADISQIIRELHDVVGESISPVDAGQIRRITGGV